MVRDMRRSARITIPLPPSEAMLWFTPEGERAWAGPHWDPHYPQPDRLVGPGTVVGSDEHSTTVEVTYDLAALSASGEDALGRFAQGYDAEIRHWQTAIDQALGAGEPRGA